MGGSSLSRQKLAPTDANLRACADALLAGEAVVMPTETVYGLAANALNRDAVLRVFRIKGRPADNPLIVHVLGIDEARDCVATWPPEAQKLAATFWPGPLTLVLPKAVKIPPEVTGGLFSVAVRVPRHKVARALLAAAKVPLCAPSANRFMALSPTTADDVYPEIGDQAFAVLDGGPCEVGIESTVFDVASCAVLRPGVITPAQLEAVLGHPLGAPTSVERLSPGQYPRHYAPMTPLELVEELGPEDAGITFGAPQNLRQRQLPRDPTAFAQALYTVLNDLDRLAAPALRVARPPSTKEWEAVWDRLRRALG